VHLPARGLITELLLASAKPLARPKVWTPNYAVRDVISRDGFIGLAVGALPLGRITRDADIWQVELAGIRRTL
jgi:hypothetical protein